MIALPSRGVVAVAALMLLSIAPVYGEEQDAPEKDVQELTQPFINDITLFGIREDGTRYSVEQPRLLMKIYALERGRNFDRTQTGALWVWGEGRPIALTELWRWDKDNSWGHTLVSTTPGYVTASVAGMTWKPEKPGLRFAELFPAITPAENFSERTEQMVQIAQRFSGFEIVKRKIVDLAMLPDPLYRYQEEGIDGAIFTLAQGENPEAFLFLEAVSDPVGPSHWRYAWAKGSSSSVTVELDGNELLQISGSLNDLGSPTEPFWVFFRAKADPAELNE